MAKRILIYFILIAALSTLSSTILFDRLKEGFSGDDGMRVFPTLTASFSDMEHIVAWHNINDAAMRVRNADVIIIGNSRSQMCFSHEVRDKAEERDLIFYNFSAGCTESFLFFKNFAEKYDVRDKIILINMGYSISEGPSICSNNAYSTSWLEARIVYSLRIAHSYMLSLVSGRKKDYIFRAYNDGLWYTHNYGNKKNTFAIEPDKRDLTSEYQSFLADTRQWCSERNLMPVLFLAPGDKDNPDSVTAAAFAERIPLIYFGSERFRTMDHSHFTNESAALFTTLFFDELDRLPTFQKALDTLKSRRN